MNLTFANENMGIMINKNNYILELGFIRIYLIATVPYMLV